MPSVVIAGGGLVGSVNACFFGKKGWKVTVFESRSDPRGIQIENGKSINLALGFRALSTLDELGLKEKVINMGVAVREKVCHQEGKKPILEKLQGLNDGDFVLTINRHELSQLLIDEAEKYSNVKFHFNNKATKFDVKSEMLIVDNGEELLSVDGDLIIACDGAHSSIRRSLLKVPNFEFSQKYIDIGYMDLSVNIPNGCELKSGIHYSWRREDLILVALVNKNQSLTVSLFAKFPMFDDHFSNPVDASLFFKKKLPTVYNILGEKHIMDTFSRNKAEAIISVQCSQHAFLDKLLLMGDSAHAMVPFQGQGVNCGLEDCLFLNEIMEELEGEPLKEIIQEYSKVRTKETNIMNGLEWKTYTQLKQSMNYYPLGWAQYFRFSINRCVTLLVPSSFALATFSREPYSEIERKAQIAERFTTHIFLLFVFNIVISSFLVLLLFAHLLLWQIGF